MDLSVGTAKTRITAAERTHRRAQGLCMYCGGVGHFAANCPLAKARPVAMRRAITAAATGGSTDTTIDSEEDSEQIRREMVGLGYRRRHLPEPRRRRRTHQHEQCGAVR